MSAFKFVTRAASSSSRSVAAPANSGRPKNTAVKSAVNSVPVLTDRRLALPKPRLQVFSNLAAYADVSSRIRQLESATGRAAMLGTGITIATEIFTDHGLFDTLKYMDVAEYCSLAGMLCLAAGGIAAQAKDPIGIDLRRAVTRSLTSLSHAAGADDGSEVVDGLIDDLVSPELLQYIIGLDAPDEE